MTSIDPSDYPFHMDSEGWPEPVYAPPYPFEHYEDHGQDESTLKHTVPLAIRRHSPGSTDPTTRSIHSPIATPKINVRRNRPQPTAPSVTFRNTPTDIFDPDDRPIRPMKDASAYKTDSTQTKSYKPPRKPLATPSSQRQQPIIKQSPRFESNSFRETPVLVSTRSITSNSSQRRPIRTDLVPTTTFYMPPAPPRSRPRQVIVEEYDDDDNADFTDDDYYYDQPRLYVKPKPDRIVSYKPVSGMTTREWENYQMSKSRRTVRVRSPPVETIIYHT